jgi:hypothetical protein
MKIFAAATLALFAAQLAFAQGGFNRPGRYQIVNLTSNRAIAIDRDGRTVIQISPRGDDADWVAEPGPNGSWIFRSAVNGRALQITSRSAPFPSPVSSLEAPRSGFLGRGSRLR